MKMLNQEEYDFILEFQTSSLHRFREIERYAELDKKLRKYQSLADIPVRFWYTKTDKLRGEIEWTYTRKKTNS